MNDNSMGCSTLERYSMITHLLSSINVSDCISEDSEHLMNIEEIKNAFNEVFKSLQNGDSASYFQIVQKISESLQRIDCTFIQSIDLACLDLFIKAIDVFSTNEECLYITFLCISELSSIEKFREHFFSNNIFQISLDSFYSESQNISFNALKVICAMIEFLLTNGIKLDLEKLLHKFKNDIYKTREHEYFIISILRSIVEYSDFSMYFIQIIDIICRISFEETPDENLIEVGETIFAILKKNFNYFKYIYYRTGTIGMLFEQLDENTAETRDIYFPIPILKIILIIIDNYKNDNLDKAIQLAKSISYDKYEEIIKKSTIQVSELALQVIIFLLLNDKENLPRFEMVMVNFIYEAPFIKKELGIDFFLIVSKEVEDADNLDLLLNNDIIEKCSFCLDSDDCEILNKYLMIILNLLDLSSKQESKSYTQKIIKDINQIDLINSGYTIIKNSPMKIESENYEFSEISLQNLNKINEIVQNNV